MIDFVTHVVPPLQASSETAAATEPAYSPRRAGIEISMKFSVSTYHLAVLWNPVRSKHKDGLAFMPIPL